jgi:hypothetical protein
MSELDRLLADADRARAAGDAAGRARALEAALAVAATGPAPGYAGVARRLARARLDAGDPVGAVAAFDGLRSAGIDPVSGWARAAASVPELCVAAQDVAGYGAPTVRYLWGALEALGDATGDVGVVATARAGLVWDAACRGDRAYVAGVVAWIAAADVHAFTAATAHPAAASPAGSLSAFQFEIAVTGAWCVAWSGDDALAHAVAALADDTWDDAGVEPAQTPWLTESLAHAARWADVPDGAAHAARWRALATTLDHPRMVLHRALAAALDHETRDAWLHAAQVAAAGAFGPEWEVYALAGAAALGDEDARRRARARADQTGAVGPLAHARFRA